MGKRNKMSERDFYSNYFRFITGIVLENTPPEFKRYKNILRFLSGTKFVWNKPKDKNRAEDAYELIFSYRDEIGAYNITDDMIRRRGCSLLDVMVALSIRCETNIMQDPDYGDRTSYWFWHMAYSLGLTALTDANFDLSIFKQILSDFFNENYSPDGEGSLFYVPDFDGDMRSLEIWYQMNEYLKTID